jgi:putative transposase
VRLPGRAFRDLDRALRDFVKSRNGQRKGRRLGFPRFKKRGRCRDSFRFSTGAIGCGRATVTLPRLGTVRTHETTRKLARRLEAGTARILSATVSRTAQRWFVSFTVEADRDIPERHPRPGSAIGIDLRVRTLLVAADDQGRRIEIPGPKPPRTTLRQLQRASRAHSRTIAGSANRRKSGARPARLHARVANVRTDALHEATDLARRYQTVAIEDLNVAGMTRTRRMARAVADQGFGQERLMLGYKTAWNGGRLVLADRFYPSSKTCSGCGAVKTKLSLSERTYRRGGSGLALDRDLNAARNLLQLAATGAESINACRAAVRPGHAGHAAMKQEPGTRQRDKTGTVPRQRGTAA